MIIIAKDMRRNILEIRKVIMKEINSPSSGAEIISTKTLNKNIQGKIKMAHKICTNNDSLDSIFIPYVY
jgi:hypothetical protein